MALGKRKINSSCDPQAPASHKLNIGSEYHGGVRTRQRTSLDPQLWSNLPEVLIDRILAALPLPSLFRFRCVCQKWDANFACGSFLADCNESQPDHGLHFIMIVERKDLKTVGFLYNRSLTDWFKMPSSEQQLYGRFDVVAAAGGLLCIKDKDSSALSVYNPLNQSLRSLPPLRDKESVFEAGMIMEKNGKEYRIIVWMDEPVPKTEVYCSKTQRWETKASVDIRGDALSQCGVVCESTFYILVINEYLSVFAYRIEDDQWTELQAPMPRDILYSYLIDQWGTLIMVGAIGKDFPTKGISIWKLAKNGLSWELVLRMPENLFKRLTRGFRPFDAFKCAGQGDQICFVTDCHAQALMYDFRQRHWWWSPKIGFKGRRQIMSSKLRLDAQA